MAKLINIPQQRRPILLGVSDLWPDPPGCLGHKLWLIIHGGTDISPEQYLNSFDRFTIDTMPSVAELQGRTIICLGQDVADIVDYYAFNYFSRDWEMGVRWSLVPQPDELDRYHNDAAFVAVTEMFFEELWEEMIDD